MSSDGSVSRWIGDLRNGSDAAAAEIWQRYCQRLLAHCGARLDHGYRRRIDPEDIASEAFTALQQALRENKYAEITDRHGLVGLLLGIATLKAREAVRHEGRAIRNLDREVSLETMGADAVANKGVTPELAAAIEDECRLLVEMLPSDLQQAARLLLDGHSNREIARRLDVAPSNIDRWVRTIRQQWQAVYKDDPQQEENP